MPLVIGSIVYLALLCANAWLPLPSAVRPDVVPIAAVIGVGYVVASLAVIAGFRALARGRSAEPDASKDGRDGAWLVAILTTGSLFPMVIAGLMRGDPTTGPVVGAAVLIMIAIAASAFAVVFTVASATEVRRPTG